MNTPLLREESVGESYHLPVTVGTGTSLCIRCPQCGAECGSLPLESSTTDGDEMHCAACSHFLAQQRGIWLTLSASRMNQYRRFVEEYEFVRASEGRGSEDSSFYLGLPYRDLTGRNQWQWRIRSRSFKYMLRKVLPDIVRRANHPLAILDLGAGNAWLSYRLAKQGHCPVAVDLIINERDGLGAALHYQKSLPNLFPRFQAEMDNLPFQDKQFDCAVFNASFHYSENYERTLGEALRCLRPEGTVIIMDSPWYSRAEPGEQMRAERREDFKNRFGFPSDGLASCEYLTDERLLALAERFRFQCKIHRPWYGFRWELRPWLAKWRGRREPAKFQIYEIRAGGHDDRSF